LTFIAKSRKKILPFIKDIIRSRLLWLNALYEAKMNYQIDKLTGLYTRSKFLEDLEQLRHSRFIFINIKNFKSINELYTSKVGDEVLKEFAFRLKKIEGALYYRLYGDRMAVVYQDDIELMLNSIEAIFHKPFFISHPQTKEPLSLQIDFQIVVFESYVDEILEKAMSAFKKSSQTVAFFHKDIEPLLKEEITYYKLLLKALEEDKVVPFFQRVVDLQKAKTAYFEALMRIIDKERIYPPVKFIEIAKERGLYTKLNKVMIKKSIESIKELDAMVSINIDIYDILQPNFIDFIKKELKAKDISGKFIQFEILETEDIYHHLQELKTFIQEVKKLGCNIALDDFGKGYSNFLALSDLLIDNLKIDMSLIQRIKEDKKIYHIVKTISQMAKDLDLQTTAEGIANKDIKNIAQKMGINKFQGYFIEKPKSIEELKDKM